MWLKLNPNMGPQQLIQPRIQNPYLGSNFGS